MAKKLRKENASDIIPRLEALQQAYATLNAEIPQMIRDEVAKGIKLNVNGKIDTLILENEQWHKERKEDMERIMPVVLAFEESVQFAQNARSSGKVILWIAGAITALGSAWLILKSIFPWL